MAICCDVVDFYTNWKFLYHLSFPPSQSLIMLWGGVKLGPVVLWSAVPDMGDTGNDGGWRFGGMINGSGKPAELPLRSPQNPHGTESGAPR